MSVYEKFTTTSAALAAFALGECRRHVEVGGHVIDLVQAMAEEGRAVVEPRHRVSDPFEYEMLESGRDLWDARVAFNIDRALRSNADAAKAGRPEVTLEVYRRDVLGIVEPDAPKPAPVCPCCLRPEGPT